MLQTIRKYARNSSLVRKFISYYLVPSGVFDKRFMNIPLSQEWSNRLAETVKCIDNKYIARVANAGKIIRGKQVMHNGLLINLGSYYGPEVARILHDNKGVHEPQEERVFSEVLKVMPEGATMIELGAFWSFYSMWFNKEVVNGQNYMIEPSAFNMGQGQRNFKLNGMTGHFTNAFIGKEKGRVEGVQVICIDEFVREHDIHFIDVLHSDIQGFEYDMLQGSVETFDSAKVGYVFISTHTNEVHDKCKEFLIDYKFNILANVNLDETYSQDGLIVGRAPYYEGIQSISLDLKGI